VPESKPVAELEQFIVLAGAEERPLTKIADYKEAGGFEALAKARMMEPAKVVQEILDSGLRGRGGAFFPTGRKASFLAKDSGKPTYLVVNADESEPGTFKDREIMFTVPHRLIEGCLITAHAIGCDRVFIYIRGEYLHEFEVVKAALEEVHKAKLLGGVTIVLHRGAGAYICGEETALLESLEGKKGMPRFKPPFPASFGLYGKPTTINNTETFAAVPWIIRNGGEWFLNLGLPNNGGTKIFSVSGDVAWPGNYEIRLGTPFSTLLEMAGGVRGGRALKAVIPGGSSAPVLPADVMMALTMDYDSIAKAGSMLGSGAVIVLDETRCMVRSLLRLSYFYFEESCGQCTPCREGTGWLWRMVDRIEHGSGRPEDLDVLTSVAENIQGRTICALGDAAALPVKSFVKHFRSVFTHHIVNWRCLVPDYVCARRAKPRPEGPDAAR
jgi:NADH-quinone oxidoreductase subunit F